MSGHLNKQDQKQWGKVNWVNPGNRSEIGSRGQEKSRQREKGGGKSSVWGQELREVVRQKKHNQTKESLLP